MFVHIFHINEKKNIRIYCEIINVRLWSIFHEYISLVLYWHEYLILSNVIWQFIIVEYNLYILFSGLVILIIRPTKMLKVLENFNFIRWQCWPKHTWNCVEKRWYTSVQRIYIRIKYKFWYHTNKPHQNFIWFLNKS